jgi:CubicO group peptidase (beta-lactamase class C family)
VPPHEPDKARITVGDLLTHQAGLAWDEWARRYRDPRRMLRSSNPPRFVMAKPLTDEPGSVFRYSTGTSQVLADVLFIATGMTPLAYARERLFGPLGLEEVRWASTRDGVSCGGTHLFLTPRQMVAIGQLCLQKGLWMGRRIVPAEWIQESTSVQAGRDWWEGPYGYHWWVRPQGYTAYGYGGQFIYVVPSASLVLVATASPNRKRHILLHDFERFIVEPLLASIHPGEAGTYAADRT